MGDASSATQHSDDSNDYPNESPSEKTSEDSERLFLWLESNDDMKRLAAIGILNPVLVNPKDKFGVKIIAFVPQRIFPALRNTEISFIKAFEDPTDASNYSFFSFN
jgi:hypothetical protein